MATRSGVNRIVVLVGIVASVLVVFGARPALACSRSGPEPIEYILTGDSFQDRGEIKGVYVQQHIVRVPDLWLTPARSVSVVERYWGDPPSDLGIVVHGQISPWVSDSCAFHSPVGTTVVGVTTADSLERGRPDYTGVDSRSFPSTGVGTVEAQFGPPVVLGVGFDDFLAAYSVLLWQPAALFLTFLGLAFLERRFWPERDSYEPNRVLLGFALTAAMFGFVLNGSDADSWYEIGVAALIAAGLAWLLRASVALLGAGVAAFGLIGNLFLGDYYGFSFTFGLIAVILGTGALVWTNDHWSRWPASFAVVAGWWIVTHDWLGTIITVLVVAALQWVNHQVTRPRKRAADTDIQLTRAE